MIENSKKNDEQEFDPENCKLANQHSASYFSVMGNHTPNVNSDCIFLNKESSEEKEEMKFPRLLALVNDGVTGDAAYLGLAPGKFAADYFSEKLPKYWRQNGIREKVKFSELVLQPSFRAKTIKDVYCWLMQCLDKSSVAIDPQMAKWIMLMHGDLFMRSRPTLPVEKLFGKTAQEISEAILIDEERLAATFRLLISLYHSTKAFGAIFQDRYGKENILGKKPFYSATTATGIIDLPNDYMLFSVGDSGGFVVDESDIVDDSTTICLPQDNKTSAIGCAFRDDSKQVKLWVPSNSIKVADSESRTSGMSGGGRKFTEKKIALCFIEKEALAGNDFALVLLTDGLMQTPNWLRTISNSVARDIGNTRRALQHIYGRALQQDLKFKNKNPRYEPDDKTMVIIKKCLT